MCGRVGWGTSGPLLPLDSCYHWPYKANYTRTHQTGRHGTSTRTALASSRMLVENARRALLASLLVTLLQRCLIGSASLAYKRCWAFATQCSFLQRIWRIGRTTRASASLDQCQGLKHSLVGAPGLRTTVCISKWRGMCARVPFCRFPPFRSQRPPCEGECSVQASVRIGRQALSWSDAGESQPKAISSNRKQSKAINESLCKAVWSKIYKIDWNWSKFSKLLQFVLKVPDFSKVSIPEFNSAK